LDSYQYGELLKSLQEKMQNIKDIINPSKLQERNKEIIAMQNDPSFWEDSDTAAKIGQEKTKIEKMLAHFESLHQSLLDSQELFEIAKNEDDEETMQMIFDEAPQLLNSIKKLEVQVMLSGKHDDSNAIISIHPGAGGTESQDWADMLFRMYLRWSKQVRKRGSKM